MLVWIFVEERGWSCVEERGWSCVEERGWSCVEVEGQWKKGRAKKTWKKQVEEKSVKIGLRKVDVLYVDQSGVLTLMRLLLG